MGNDSPEARCSHCGGHGFATGIRIDQTAEIGDIGLSYKDGWVLAGTEPLRADLCTTCGTIQRLYVENTKHHWLTE